MPLVRSIVPCDTSQVTPCACRSFVNVAENWNLELVGTVAVTGDKPTKMPESTMRTLVSVFFVSAAEVAVIVHLENAGLRRSGAVGSCDFSRIGDGLWRGENDGRVGGVCGDGSGGRAAGLRGSRRLFSGAVERRSGVIAGPGHVRVGAAGDAGGERQRLRNDNGQRRCDRALWRNGNDDNVSDAAAAAATGQN